MWVREAQERSSTHILTGQSLVRVKPPGSRPPYTHYRCDARGRSARTQVFSELQSHYLFDDRFGRPGKGNDKGKVEGLVGYARRNFFVPVPRVASWDALNADVERQCRARRGQRLRRHTETIGERFARDRAAVLPLPPVPYEACDTRPTRVTSLSLVRYRRNDYSVPTAYGHREVVVKGYVDTVVVVCGSTVIARHPRSYERDALIFEPRHYLRSCCRGAGRCREERGEALPEQGQRRAFARLPLVDDGLPRRAHQRGQLRLAQPTCATQRADLLSVVVGYTSPGQGHATVRRPHRSAIVGVAKLRDGCERCPRSELSKGRPRVIGHR